MSISGNLVGTYSQLGKTFIIQDADGNELTGVVVDQETIFTATDNDVREGYVYASDEGVSIGTKNIPIYRTEAGYWIVLPGEYFSIPLPGYDKYDYTKLQCIIVKYNTTFDDSVEADRVVIDDSVYQAASVTKLSDVTKNTDTQSIDLNITNDSDSIYIVRYFTYREEI